MSVPCEEDHIAYAVLASDACFRLCVVLSCSSFC